MKYPEIIGSRALERMTALEREVERLRAVIRAEASYIHAIAVTCGEVGVANRLLAHSRRLDAALFEGREARDGN